MTALDEVDLTTISSQIDDLIQVESSRNDMMLFALILMAITAIIVFVGGFHDKY